MFIETTATGADVPNLERAFSARPAVFAAWQSLLAAIKEEADFRRHELATLAAARSLGSSYCMLAHGRLMINEELLTADEVRAVAADHRTAGLEPVEVAVMDLAEQVVADAKTITSADFDRLRELGLTDAQIFDVVLAAAARCFFSKVLDAVGAQADPGFANLDADLREVLVVGRPIAAG